MKAAVIVSVSRAQLRILQRLRRGEWLPIARYRPEHATMRALDRKGLVAPKERVITSTPRLHVTYCSGVWELTGLGARVAVARNGVLREGEEPVRAPMTPLTQAEFEARLASTRSREAAPRMESTMAKYREGKTIGFDELKRRTLDEAKVRGRARGAR